MTEKNYLDLNPHARILLGPGPGMAAPRVIRAMATPPIHWGSERFRSMNISVNRAEPVTGSSPCIATPQTKTRARPPSRCCGRWLITRAGTGR